MRRSISGELTCRLGLCEEDRRRPTVSPVCRCVPVMKPPSGRLDPRPLVSVAATASSPPSSVRAAVCLPACLLHTVYTLQPAVQPAVKCQRTFSPLSTQPTNNVSSISKSASSLSLLSNSNISKLCHFLSVLTCLLFQSGQR